MMASSQKGILMRKLFSMWRERVLKLGQKLTVKRFAESPLKNTEPRQQCL